MSVSPETGRMMLHGLRRLAGTVARTTGTSSAGFDEVVCGTSFLFDQDADGVRYRNVSVTELAGHPFEQCCSLLLFGSLSCPETLADLCSLMGEAALPDPSAVRSLTSFPLRSRPIELLPAVITMLGLYESADGTGCTETGRLRVMRLISQLPAAMAMAAGHTQTHGEESGEDPSEPSLASRILMQFRHSEGLPTPEETEAMDCLLTCQSIGELRPADYAARFVSHSGKDVMAGIRSAASAFSSQLRRDPFEWMAQRFSEWTTPGAAEAWFRKRRSASMPCGFSDQNPDPRCMLLRNAARRLLGSTAAINCEAASSRIEQIMADQGYTPTRDWVSARLMTLLRIPADRMSVIVAIARTPGWAAHGLEQMATDISLLPRLLSGTDSADLSQPTA